MLVADGSADQRTACTAALAADGRFAVVGDACDGADLLLKVAAADPHLVLAAEDMPVLDGVSVLPYLRRAAPRALLAVITDRPTRAAERRALAAGAAAYLRRPAADDTLGDLILIACERRRAERRESERRRTERRTGLRDRRARSRGQDRRQGARRRAERRLGDRRLNDYLLPAAHDGNGSGRAAAPGGAGRRSR